MKRESNLSCMHLNFRYRMTVWKMHVQRSMNSQILSMKKNCKIWHHGFALQISKVTDRVRPCVVFLLSRMASHEEALAISRHKEEEERECGRREEEMKLWR